MSATRRGGIPGPESRTGLVRPAMTEAEFERRLAAAEATAAAVGRRRPTATTATTAPTAEPEPEPDPEPTGPAEPAAARRARPVDVAGPKRRQAPAGPADVRHRGGAGQEALALRHPRRQGPLRGRQRPAPAAGRLDGPLRLPRPPLQRPLQRRPTARTGRGGEPSPYTFQGSRLWSRALTSSRGRPALESSRYPPSRRRRSCRWASVIESGKPSDSFALITNWSRFSLRERPARTSISTSSARRSSNSRRLSTRKRLVPEPIIFDRLQDHRGDRAAVAWGSSRPLAMASSIRLDMGGFSPSFANRPFVCLILYPTAPRNRIAQGRGMVSVVRTHRVSVDVAMWQGGPQFSRLGSPSLARCSGSEAGLRPRPEQRVQSPPPPPPAGDVVRRRSWRRGSTTRPAPGRRVRSPVDRRFPGTVMGRRAGNVHRIEPPPSSVRKGENRRCNRGEKSRGENKRTMVHRRRWPLAPGRPIPLNNSSMRRPTGRSRRMWTF